MVEKLGGSELKLDQLINEINAKKHTAKQQLDFLKEESFLYWIILK